MKTSYLQNNWSSWRLIAICLFSAAIITGCGSGGGFDSTAGVGTGGTGTLAKTVSGTVADGYLVNATVFLDRNGNYQLDAGEPSTTTDLNGTYKLNVDPADIGKHPIVALIIKDVTIDKDTNQKVLNSYVLSMPKENVSGSVSDNFISPISSQLRELMETGRYTTVLQAADALRTQMGLPAGTDITANYIVSNHTVMHYDAQNMATLMGNQMGHVMGMDGSSIIVDVNLYRTMMGTIYTNMSTVCAPDNHTEMTDLSDTMTTTLSHMH
ncbi:MAG: hypothetical protein HIU83_04600 [Proteobacteria bacterium]|nr:hypothetical protein [Pseudomonadota bacterium]